jgi:hypothetical protein
MKFHHGAPDCFTCSKRVGYDLPFTMACFMAGHLGSHHMVGEEE